MMRLVGAALVAVGLAGCGRNGDPPGALGAGGAAGSGGSAGAVAGSDAGAALLEVAAVLDGYVMKQPCLEDSGPRSCRTHPPGYCPTDPDPMHTGARPTAESLALGGRSGVIYDVTLRVQGIVESKVYRGGTDVSDLPAHGFQRGGSVDNSSNQRSSFALRVTAPVGDYFFNALGRDALGPSTFVVDYEATIPLSGGAPFELVVSDPNCQALKNCLPGEPGETCRPADVPELEPKIRAGLGTEPAAFDGQFLGFAVKAVSERD